MKREVRNYVLAVLTTLVAVFSTGCQTLQPEGIAIQSLNEQHGGGGGDN